MSSPTLRRVIGMMAKAVSSFTYATWNPSDKGSNIVLSGGNLTSTNSGGGSVRANLAKSSGKWYWEVKVLATGTGTISIGVADSSANLTTYAGFDAHGWAYLQTGSKFTAGTPNGYGSAYGINDIIGVALDMDSPSLKFYLNNTLQGVAYTSSLGTPLYPIVGAGGGASGESLLTNFGASALTYSPPAGYNAGLY